MWQSPRSPVVASWYWQAMSLLTVLHQSGTAAAQSNCHTAVASLLNFWEAFVTSLQLQCHITIIQEWQNVNHWIFWMCSKTFSFFTIPMLSHYIYCKIQFVNGYTGITLQYLKSFPYTALPASPVALKWCSAVSVPQHTHVLPQVFRCATNYYKKLYIPILQLDNGNTLPFRTRIHNTCTHTLLHHQQFCSTYVSFCLHITAF